MKRLFVAIFFSLPLLASANDHDSTINYTLPDSVKAVQFMAEVGVNTLNNKKFCSIGIRTDAVELMIDHYSRWRLVAIRSNKKPGKTLTTGIGSTEYGKAKVPHYQFELQPGESYKLMISQATDSAGNFSLYSGYIFLSRENKWKFIGTLRIDKQWSTLQQPSIVYKNRDKKEKGFVVKQVWIQRNNGSWKDLNGQSLPTPTINLFGHIDSAQQRQLDTKIITDAIAAGKTDAKDVIEGVFYKMIREGNGNNVNVTDTVTAYYRVTLFGDTATIDQAKDKPAVFPLKRLIRGWQIGVPLCKEGGKIKLVIPSDLAYSIRTRSARIPPNSILEFEIEIVSTKTINSP